MMVMMMMMMMTMMMMMMMFFEELFLADFFEGKFVDVIFFEGYRQQPHAPFPDLQRAGSICFARNSFVMHLLMFFLIFFTGVATNRSKKYIKICRNI